MYIVTTNKITDLNSYLSQSLPIIMLWVLLPVFLHSLLIRDIIQTLLFTPNMILLPSELLWIRDLRVGQWKEPCIGLTQENSIENSIQDCLLYIPNYLVHASYCVSYLKLPCVSLKVNIHCVYCITSSF